VFKIVQTGVRDPGRILALVLEQFGSPPVE
jgi:hypothetical protein